MKPGKHAALIAGLALALSGCIGTAEEEKPAPPPPSVSEQEQPGKPAPKAPPAPAEAPTDNCGLEPAYMDEATKVQCGLIPEDPAPGNDSGGRGTFDNGEPIPYEPDWSSFEAQCQSGVLTVEDGCSSANTPEDDGPGSLYTNPESPQYQQYREDTGYPYPEEQYDELHGYQQCGTACGKDPTSGQLQHQHGCEQGYITEGC